LRAGTIPSALSFPLPECPTAARIAREIGWPRFPWRRHAESCLIAQPLEDAARDGLPAAADVEMVDRTGVVDSSRQILAWTMVWPPKTTFVSFPVIVREP
jgi:hypothetical protein